MILDWSQVKSVFQIPKRWFSFVHNFCCRSYGGNLISIRQDESGAAEIYVDDEEFQAKVLEVAGDGGVKTVDGKGPDGGGDVAFGLAASKWMKTDAQGHLGTSDETPLTLDQGATGVLYGAAGALQYKTIGDAPGDVAAGDHIHTQYLTSLPTSCLTTNDINAPATSTRGVAGNYHSNAAYTGTLHGALDNLYSWTGIYGGSTNIHSGNIDDYLEDDYVTVDTDQTVTGSKTFVADVELRDGANMRLEGATNGNAIEVSYGGYKTQQLPGRIEMYYTTPYIDFHQNSDASDYTSRLICASQNTQLIDNRGIILNAQADKAVLANQPTADAKQKESKAIATVGWTASNFVPATGYAASKWVKTDADGMLATTDDVPIAVDTTKYTPQNTTLTCVTEVKWTGTVLQQTSRTLQFKNGVLVSVGNASTSTIDTPVAY